MNLSNQKELQTSTRSNSKMNETVKPPNFIIKHFFDFTYQDQMTSLFVELIPGKPHEKLLQKWEHMYWVFYSEWARSPVVALAQLRRQLRWPEKTHPPMNFLQVLVRLIQQEKLLLIKQRSFTWNYKQCLVDIYNFVSADFDEHITKKENSHQGGNYTKIADKDFFLVDKTLSRRCFQSPKPNQSGIFSNLGRSLLTFIGSKSRGGFSYKHIFNPKRVRKEDLFDSENLILNVAHLKELVRQARSKMDQVFCYSQILPRKLFISRLKNVLGVSDKTAIDFVILFLQFEKQFNWDVFNNHFFFYKWDWPYEALEIQQQLSILNIMNLIVDIQDLSKVLNESVFKIRRMHQGDWNKSVMISIKNEREIKLETNQNIFSQHVVKVNSLLRNLAQECLRYDDISGQIYKGDRSILWTTSTKGFHNSNTMSSERAQLDTMDEINAFQTGDQSSPTSQETNSAKKSRQRLLKFRKNLDLLFTQNEDLIKKYFGDVKQGYRKSPDFEFQTFRKILRWLRKVSLHRFNLRSTISTSSTRSR